MQRNGLVALAAPSVVLLLALVISLGSCSDGSRSSNQTHLNILLISVDTLRPDHLSLYGYRRETSPHLARFFADAEIYERAYAAHACTPPSTISLLTGLYPATHRVRGFYRPLPPRIPLLSDVLRDAGYQTAGVVSNHVLGNKATGLGARFDFYDDVTDERQPTRREFFERRGARTTNAALAWLKSQRDPNRLHFLWVHYMDPHAPYIPPKKVADFTHAAPTEIDLDRVLWHTRLPGVSDGEEYVDRYDEEIAYTDFHIGRLLAAYEDLGLIENTIVVLTADHGETMIEHDQYFAHCFNVWDAVMRIPLAVRRPGIRGRRSEVPVSNVDVVPSLLEYVGLAAQNDLDGKPFAQRADTDRIYLEATFETKYKGHTRGVVEGTKKWGVLVRRAKIVDRWFVDLEADPNETEVREWQAGESGSALLARIGRELGKQRPSERLDQRTDLDADELEALHELGYLE